MVKKKNQLGTILAGILVVLVALGLVAFLVTALFF
jgi:hypothetical protein